ncbi:MAG: hypothetical protein R2791_16420 [Saprospiraceae bacterium]
MDTEKEKWKDEVLNSLEGRQAAEPNPYLFTRVAQRIRDLRAPEAEGQPGRFSASLAVAFLALILIVNVVAIRKSVSGGASQVRANDSEAYSAVFADHLNPYEE